MKRICKNIVISTHLFDHPDLSVLEKWVLIAIDTVSDSCGVVIGTQAISSLTGLPTNEVKRVLKSLQSKGALDVRIDEDGAKRLFVYLWKERYIENTNNIVIGDKQSDIADPIDYQLIQDTWNSVCDKLPRLDKFTARRKQKTRTCLKGASATQTDMIKVIRLVATSAFLKGEKSHDWRATYDWVIKSPDNFTKIIEGQYHKDYGERKAYEAIIQGRESIEQQTVDEIYR